MITIENKVVKVEHYPDGTQRIKLDFIGALDSLVGIGWKYENDSECMTLKYIVDTLKKTGRQAYLTMPYIPNARMDRVKCDSEVFTLKSFTDFINTLGFSSVRVLDAHSNVSLALINNVLQLDVKPFIKIAIDTLIEHGDGIPILYFPDAGALKRYSDIFESDSAFNEFRCLYGYKKRDWKTGEIKRLSIFDANNKEISKDSLDGATILMIDDIISYGGTMFYSAKALKEYGAGKIYAYATHTENSVLDEKQGKLIKLMTGENPVVTALFTVDTIYSGNCSAVITIPFYYPGERWVLDTKDLLKKL